MPNCRNCSAPLDKESQICPVCDTVPEPKRGSFALSSLGSGVRAQVFEVIVRQAIAGAPWREICAGPMKVNHISAEEVQEEIDRRTGGADGLAGSGVPKKPYPDSGSHSAEAKAAPESLRAALFEVIVRQAVAGAPWRLICARPMRDHNITTEEIEAEVARRKGIDT